MQASEPYVDRVLPGLDSSFDATEPSINQVLLKGGHIYQHNVFCVNYMTYDICCDQDTFNPNSDHHDIMLLLAPDDTAEGMRHHFCYARIIGIYHANVQYIGSGLKDYNARWLDFLHVRWFKWIPSNPQPSGIPLDLLQFVPMDVEGVFDFVDPVDVLRGCHLIPTFTKGWPHPDCSTLSSIAKDSADWWYYYVNMYFPFQPTDSLQANVSQTDSLIVICSWGITGALALAISTRMCGTVQQTK